LNLVLCEKYVMKKTHRVLMINLSWQISRATAYNGSNNWLKKHLCLNRLYQNSLSNHGNYFIIIITIIDSYKQKKFSKIAQPDDNISEDLKS
jgi:hypothetical protein